MSDPVETTEDFKAALKRTVDDSNAIFAEMQKRIVEYFYEHKPVPTGVALALIDLLVVWSQAMGASRGDIIYAFDMAWDNTARKPQERINSIRRMDKNAN